MPHAMRTWVRTSRSRRAVAPSKSGSIRMIGDLKGRTVGVSAPGSTSHQILNFLLVSNGLSPDTVSTVSVGMSASSVAALEHGTVDAAVLLASAIAAFERHGRPRIEQEKPAHVTPLDSELH